MSKSEYIANLELQKVNQKPLLNERKPIKIVPEKLGNKEDSKTWQLITQY